MDGLESKRKISILENQLGQSTVEYLMLMAVVLFVVYSVFQSDYFKNFFGEDGTFAAVFRQEIEFSYTNAYTDRKFFREPDYLGEPHPSYEEFGQTRFFGALESYPKE